MEPPERTVWIVEETVDHKKEPKGGILQGRMWTWVDSFRILTNFNGRDLRGII